MELAERYGIMSIPAIFMFKDGNLIAKTGGYQGKEIMRKYTTDETFEKIVDFSNVAAIASAGTDTDMLAFFTPSVFLDSGYNAVL